MGRRGPKLTKDATLGARITSETRKRLEQAADSNGVSLSQELEERLAWSLGNETEDHLLRVIRELVRRVEAMTGASWVKNPYTFDLMHIAVVMLLDAFRPDGEVVAPETMQPFTINHSGPGGGAMADEARRLMRSMVEKQPPSAFALSIVGSVIIDLQQRDAGVHLSPAQRMLFKRAHEYLDQLITDPLFRVTPKKDASNE